MDISNSKHLLIKKLKIYFYFKFVMLLKVQI